MSPIEEAILRTVIYADIFNFPLTLPELHHFLITDQPTSLSQIERSLATSSALKPLLEVQQGYVTCAQRVDLISLRQERDQISQRLWPLALVYGVWLARLPFVRMVALTGALAMRNAPHHDDDLDYVLVTAPGRVWLARAFSILLVKLVQRQGVVICPNYVLSETALAQERHDIFIAHEVAQMVPIYGRPIYNDMRTSNRWVEAHLANAKTSFYQVSEHSPSRAWRWLKRSAEFLLGGTIGDKLENWEYQRKLRRFAADLQTPNSAARLDDQQVKGHFRDHGHPVLQQYQERLRQYDLDALSLAGD